MSGAMDSVDTYGNGMSALGATPFKFGWSSNNTFGHTAYINKDGYLYGVGSNMSGNLGIGNTTLQLNFVKMGVQTGTTGTGVSTTGFKNPIDYDLDRPGSIVVDQYGKVWTAGRNSSGSLGWGSSYADTSYTYFRTVATSGTTGATYLPTNYTAVAVATAGFNHSSNANMILTSEGALYGAGLSSALGGAATTSGTFTRLDTGTTSSGLPAATTSNPIVDFGGGNSASYVLYKDGSLYRGTSSWSKIASNITMFDIDTGNNYCYMYNSSTNKIQYSSSGGTPVDLVTPTGTVTQIRGATRGWGYLNSAGTLFLSSSSTSTAPETSNSTPTGTTFYQISNVSYFDIGGNVSAVTYGIIQNGVTKFWGDQGGSGSALGTGSTATVTYASPSTPSNVDTTYMPEPLDRDISNTPPAITDFSNEK